MQFDEDFINMWTKNDGLRHITVGTMGNDGKINGIHDPIAVWLRQADTQGPYKLQVPRVIDDTTVMFLFYRVWLVHKCA